MTATVRTMLVLVWLCVYKSVVVVLYFSHSLCVRVSLITSDADYFSERFYLCVCFVFCFCIFVSKEHSFLLHAMYFSVV